ncbi:helix-turn-helix domain-containing protein [Streptomyces sp. NBC_00988]|uniref:ArsR/SmtB family transcription factor n=1 Tax=Streptomyces sp. NBC_00988 TaxID=2903704 RepID=UPI00386B4342|nr:helix-turn-helix domain-containing protein [Streptomyces sp. NBC_00988]
MALRIHFSPDDFLRVTLARGCDPLLETIVSLRVVQEQRPAAPFVAWQRWAGSRLPRSFHLLRGRVPTRELSPEFSLPLGAPALGTGPDALPWLAQARLRADFYAGLAAPDSPAGRPVLLAWTRSLADGSPRALEALSAALQDWHRLTIAPLQDHIRSRVDAARSGGVRQLLAGGLDAMLARLHPTMRWRSPVLELHSPEYDLDIHLGGRGLHLVPSFFQDGPLIYLDPELSPAVVYPINHDVVWDPGTHQDRTHDARQSKMAALLGATRATVLRAIATQLASTTEDLALQTGISPATVSHHTAVLRDAGLITTHRTGGSVHHTTTPLGWRLLHDVYPADPLAT